jgi:hypothetical protein
LPIQIILDLIASTPRSFSLVQIQTSQLSPTNNDILFIPILDRRSICHRTRTPLPWTLSTDPHTGTFDHHFGLSIQHANFMLSLSHPEFPSQQSSVGITYSTTEARYPAGIPNTQQATTTQHPAQNSHTTTNGYQFHNGYVPEYNDEQPYTSGVQSTSTSTYHTFSSPEYQQESSWDGQGYQEYGQYYLPATSYPSQSQPNYDSVLVIDTIEDEHSEAWVDLSRSNHAGFEGVGLRPQQPSTDSRHNQQNTYTENFAHTPTARRWSREYSPEERLRIGLPRWETEQHRIEYQRRQNQGRQHHRSQGSRR